MPRISTRTVDTIPTKHQTLVNDAIAVCEEAYNAFFTAVTKFYGEEEGREIIYFLLDNTYFAGGVFRSVFTNSSINDIDVFFTSPLAVAKFKSIFQRSKSLFSTRMVSKNGSFSFTHSVKKPSLSFVTCHSAPADEMLNSFDFTFNAHYYDMQSSCFKFDIDTFDKHGFTLDVNNNPNNSLFRALRFAQEGFSIGEQGLKSLVAAVGSSTPLEVGNEVLEVATGRRRNMPPQPKSSGSYVDGMSPKQEKAIPKKMMRFDYRPSYQTRSLGGSVPVQEVEVRRNPHYWGESPVDEEQQEATNPSPDVADGAAVNPRYWRTPPPLATPPTPPQPTESPAQYLEARRRLEQQRVYAPNSLLGRVAPATAPTETTSPRTAAEHGRDIWYELGISET